jgi:gamma-glutamyl:cysteine ligase YbdK (ATP-grasp superfamily)
LTSPITNITADSSITRNYDTDKNAMTEDVEMISTEVDNRGRTASLNSNNNVANLTNKTNNEEQYTHKVINNPIPK